MPAGASVSTGPRGALPALRDPAPPTPPEKQPSPPSLPNVFSCISAALSSRALPQRRSPPRGRRRPQLKATRSVVDMLRLRPPPPTLWPAPCSIRGFGDLSDPLLPTLRRVSGDVVRVCCTRIRKHIFSVCSLAKGWSKLCQRCEMIVSTTYISKWGGAQPVDAAFHVRQLKKWNFENLFFDSGTTKNDHPMYIKHVLRVFPGIWVLGARGGGVLPRDWYKTC